MNRSQKEQLVLKLFELSPTEFHHGDCIGADAEAHDIVREFFPQTKIVIHPPRLTYQRAYRSGDEYREPLDYIPRDRNIVESTDYLVGTPLDNDPATRSGTWATIRHAIRTKKSHQVIER